MELKDKANIIIDNEIAKEYRKEAKEIISLASEKQVNEFISYFEKDMINICCLVLDTIKQDLVKNNKLSMKDSDVFGKPFE
jgi:hypothetical protein